MAYRGLGLALALASVTACQAPEPTSASDDPKHPARQALAPLPRAVTNNAVAALQLDGRDFVFSFLGLGPGKTWRDTTSTAWVLERDAGMTRSRFDAGHWRQLADVPGPGGRLAATAVSVTGRVYIFGGYTVAEDGSEKSVPLVHRLDPATMRYETLAPMPVPVDDTVALVYRDRYVYLVSGWHDTDNVDLVQVLDTATDTWFAATPFPGPPVFGHAGGIVGNNIIVCDGVKVVPRAEGKRSFLSSALCFKGVIDANRPEHIDWTPIAHHPGPALYRMAAGANASTKIFFAGGSDNPYNYDGIGYDGNPSQPSSTVFAYDLQLSGWIKMPDLPVASMDHRGLVKLADGYALIGGMGREQEVLSRTLLLELE